MITRIGIIRHGTTLWNQTGKLQGSTDVPLHEEGIRQAQRLAQRLNGGPWNVMYTSHLTRARQTGTIIAESVGIRDIRQDERIAEANGGLLEGTTEADRIQRWGENWRQLDLGMESADSIVARGSAFMEDILQRHPGGHILIVSHGSFIRQMLRTLVPHQPIEEMLGNTSITQLYVQDSCWNCERFNCTEHLRS